MNAAAPADRRRLRVTVGGRVQGVGLRPSVYRLAKQFDLGGWVANTRGGVVIEIEGNAPAIDDFLHALRVNAPAQAEIAALRHATIPCTGANDFSIVENFATEHEQNSAHLSIPLDLAICESCRAELFDQSSRRHRHAFVACCDCGPRWSALAALPWQRANTAMAGFAPCAECNAEYTDPDNRRFHAQNNCCPNCGPQLAFWNAKGETLAVRDRALRRSVEALREGAIVAVKGLGGFHLMIDARNTAAIARLRERKRRPHKPFAVMFEHLVQLENYCACDAAERALLTSAEAPIVLLRSLGKLPERLAPGNPRLGAMLAYTPLHLLLLRDAGFPLVATSGNRSGEPICADENRVREQLGDIADYYLVHDRPILQPIDDSVVQIAADRPLLLRCARGYAPLDFSTHAASGESFLAFGGQQKAAIALADNRRIRVSPHIGDLGSTAGDCALEGTIENLRKFSNVRTAKIVCDLHPDYRSSKLAQTYTDAPLRVQHHHAHIAAVMAEHHLDGEVLGIAWDGSGLGNDGSLWGGEFLRATRSDYARCASLRTFALPGGEAAVREPRRAALSLLHAVSGGDLQRYADLPLFAAFARNELSLLQSMLARNVNCPRSSSVGRLFDAVAALLGLQTLASFEGQAAMALQFAAECYPGEAEPFAFTIDESSAPHRIDWVPLIEVVISSFRKNVAAEQIAARFHATLAAIATTVTEASNCKRVVLTGGCFQNRLLLEKTIAALQQIDCAVFWPQRLPPNDGALALGQITVAGG